MFLLALFRSCTVSVAFYPRCCYSSVLPFCRNFSRDRSLAAVVHHLLPLCIFTSGTSPTVQGTPVFCKFLVEMMRRVTYATARSLFTDFQSRRNENATIRCYIRGFVELHDTRCFRDFVPGRYCQCPLLTTERLRAPTFGRPLPLRHLSLRELYTSPPAAFFFHLLAVSAIGSGFFHRRGV